MDCVICGKRGGDLRLAGGYVTTLCMDHSNEWREHCAGLDEFLQMNALLAMEARIMVTGTDVEVKDIMRRVIEARLAMYHKAKEWVESQVNY